MSADKYPCIFSGQMAAIVYIYVASYVLNVTTVPFEIKFTRRFLLQGFRLFCYQFVE